MIINKLKNIYISKKNRGKVYIKKNAVVSVNSSFEGNNIIGNETVFSGSLGFSSYIGARCNISAKIKRYSSISNDVSVIYYTHPLSPFVSTSPPVAPFVPTQNAIPAPPPTVSPISAYVTLYVVPV